MTQRINSYFDSSQELRQLSHKAGQLLELQRQFEQIAPSSLTCVSRIMQLEQQTLMISADNSAVAAKLRQLAPALVLSFRDNGREVTAIQVRVQVASSPATYRSSPASVSPTGRQRLTALAEKLPDSPLKSALLRLANGKPEPK